MGQRTSDRLKAGKRAAEHIACSVCQERVLSLFPAGGDADSIDHFVEGDSLGESLGDAKQLCGMRVLAKLFKSRRLDVATRPDGSAALARTEDPPFYEEINTSDLAFHWKSFALQHACTETFRRDGDAVAQAVLDGYRKLADADTGDEQGSSQRRLVAAVKAGCGRARTCKAAARKASKSGAGKKQAGGQEL